MPPAHFIAEVQRFSHKLNFQVIVNGKVVGSFSGCKAQLDMWLVLCYSSLYLILNSNCRNSVVSFIQEIAEKNHNLTDTTYQLKVTL